jgi:CBS-domain-containing membrane protein
MGDTMNESPLSTFRFPPNTCIAHAEPQRKGDVSMESPGLDVMTDLSLVKAATIDPATQLRNAEQIMIHQGVRLLFVVRDFPCVEGLITANDLLGDKPMRAVHDRNIRRQDLCVADVMTELSSLDALDYADLKACNVGKVVATFRRFGRSHLLVVQAADKGSPARIRGVISLTQVERQLGGTVTATEIASTFAEIEKVLI